MAVKKALNRVPAKMGRPTLYKPEFCEQVIALGKQGKSITQMAAKLEVDKASLLKWKNEKDEFSTALRVALTYSQDWWEDKAQTGLVDRNFNAALWKHCVTSRFREDYAEKREEGPSITIVTNSTVDVRQLGDDARDALRMALLSAGKTIEHDPGER
jgi:transposase-like protein